MVPPVPPTGRLARRRVGRAVKPQPFAPPRGGRADVDDTDWTLAAHVAERSRATRQCVVDVIAAANAAGNRRRAHAEAERAVLVAERLDTASVQRVARRLVRRLEGRGWVPRNDLRKTSASPDRAYFDAAIDVAGPLSVTETWHDYHPDQPPPLPPLTHGGLGILGAPRVTGPRPLETPAQRPGLGR